MTGRLDRDGGDDRRRERRLVVEVRQEPGDRPGEERLARARRPDQQQPVAAGERDLERPPGVGLAADVGQVDDASGPSAPGDPPVTGAPTSVPFVARGSG